MRLCVTGSSSFVGRELIDQCERAGIECIGVDSVPPTRVSCREMDIRSAELVDAVPENVDAMVHLAALSRDRDCIDNAYACFDVNVMGTLNVMRAASARHARQFIFASSEWVYDSFDGTAPRDEASVIDLRRLQSEYALSKLVGEAVLQQKYGRGFCDTTILRFGIIYGPRPGNWSAVESLMHAVKSGRNVTIGSRDTARRFIHVSDVAAGILSAIGLQGCHVINLEGGRLITLGEVIDTAATVLNVRPRVIVGDAAASVRNVSDDKAKRLLDWEPAIDLEAGLRSLVSFV